MPEDHPHHVAMWLAEVFGGPPRYSEELGGYHRMVTHHLGLAITEEQRFRWITLIAQAADEAGLPDDPEFRSAFLAYLEWGNEDRPAQLAAGRVGAVAGAHAALGLGRGASLPARLTVSARARAAGARRA
jgi:hemoglobin